MQRRFLFVTLAVTAVILHGSLYPYDFHVPSGSAGPVVALLRSWGTQPDSFGEMIANILLYVPLGFFAALTIRVPRRLLVVTLLGLALSTAVELTQFYDAGRVTSLTDVCLNTFGTGLGALAAIAVRIPFDLPIFKAVLARPVPFVLLIAMFGYRLYPYVPTIDLHKYWHSVKPLLFHPAVGTLDIFRYFALWLTICFLTSDAAGRARSWFFVLCAGAIVFAGKILIVNQSLSLAEIAGAALAVLLWLAMPQRMSRAAAIVAAVLCATIIVSRLEPFVFRATPAHFGWMPFRSFLNGSLAVNVQSLFEKAFLYGSLVWIAGRAGLDLRVATIAAAALVLTTSIVGIYLPGRSAEITDALITLLMGTVFVALTGSVHVASRGSSPSK
jgi:VanZ family protein